jgi:hypothetical protein
MSAMADNAALIRPGAAGLGGADNLIIHIPSGDAFFNGEYIGDLKDE